MKKTIIILLLSVSALGGGFASDYRQVIFGNNYEKIRRVTDKAVMQSVIEKAGKYNLYNYMNVITPRKSFMLFKENFSNGTVYRLLAGDAELSETRLLNYLLNASNESLVVQYVFIQIDRDLFCISAVPFYDEYDSDDDSYADFSAHRYVFRGIEVLQRNNKIQGFLEHRLMRLEVIDENRFIHPNEARYISYDTVKSLMSDGKHDNSILIQSSDILISGSYALFDPKRPFMYTIQNAFDGNRATSFVEDTKNNLSFITLLHFPTNCTKLRIINGYAANENLYLSNNRIKTVRGRITDAYWFLNDPKYDAGNIGQQKCFGKEYVLQDNTLDYQVIPDFDGKIIYDYFSVAFTDIYKGEKYNDTCLAELDFYVDEKGWFFGGDT